MGYCASMVSCKFSVKTENFGRVHKKLERHGYTPETDDEGNVTGLDFRGDKLSYDEGKMFAEIAPYVEDGSYIEMQGEDGAAWRWVFNKGKAREIKATITWPDGGDEDE